MDETRFLKGLYDGMRCGILSIDRDGRLVVLNDLGARILDLATTPAPGTNVELALDRQPRLVRMLLASFETQRLPNREEFVLDFINFVPPQGAVTARILTSPAHLKRIVLALQDNLQRYEARYGEVHEAAEPAEGNLVH